MIARLMRAVVVGAVGLLGLMVLAAGAGGLWLQGEGGRQWLLAQVGTLLLPPGQSLSGGRLEGTLPLTPVVRDLELSDDHGRFLSLDRLVLSLNPWPLLRGGALTVTAAADTVTVWRPPHDPADDQEDAGLIPTPATVTLELARSLRLPVPLAVTAARVERLELAPPVLGGVAAALTVSGHGRLAQEQGERSLSLALSRLDGRPGQADLTFALEPQQDRLTLEGEISESAGGLMAALLGLPRQPPVTLTLHGSGPLSSWQGRLEAQVGPQTRLAAEAQVVADGPGWRLELVAGGDPRALLPDPWAGLVGPVPGLKGQARVSRAGRIELSDLTLTAAAGRARVEGVVDPLKDRLELSARLEHLEPAALAPLVPGLQWRALALAAQVRGRLDQPTVTAQLTAEGPRLAPWQLERARLELTAAAEGTRWQWRAGGRVEGLTGPAPQVAALAGPALTLAAEGRASAAELSWSKLNLSGPGGVLLDGSGRLELVRAGVSGTATVALERLERWARPLGLERLSGAGRFELALTPAATGGAVLAVEGSTQGLVTGLPALDQSLGPQPLRLGGRIAWGAGAPLRLSDGRLDSALGSLRAEGSLDERGLQASGRVELPELSALSTGFSPSGSPPLQGPLTLDVTASGPLARPLLTLQARSPGVSLGQQRLAALEVELAVTGLPGAPKGTLSAAATPSGPGGGAGRVSLASDYQLTGSTQLALERLALTVGGNRITGGLSWPLDGGAGSGRLELALGDLPALAALLGGPTLAGQARGELILERRGAQAAQGLRLAVRAERLALGEVQADQLTLSAEGTPAALALRLQTAAQLDPADSASHAGLDLNATLAREANGWRATLERAQGTVGADSLRLLAPASLRLADDGPLVLERLELSLGAARLSGRGRLGADGRIEAQATLAGAPLTLARLVAPELALTGQADAVLTLGGSRARPTADLSMHLTQVAPAAAEVEGAADGELTAQWRDGSVRLQGRAWTQGQGQGKSQSQSQSQSERPAGGELSFTAELPLVVGGGPLLPPRGRLAGRVQGSLALAALNDLLATSGDRLGGQARVDLTLAGTVATPELGGSLELQEARYENAATGMVLSHLSGRLSGNGSSLTIERLGGQTAEGGTVALEGGLRLAPGPTRGLDLTIIASHARLLQNDLIQADADARLTLTGTPERARLAGTVTVLRADLVLPERPPAAVAALDVREVARVALPAIAGTGTSSSPAHQPASAGRFLRVPLPSRKPLAGGGPLGGGRLGGGPASLVLEVTIAAPSQVFVRGRGLDLELGGTMTVAGSAAEPHLGGGLSLVRGQLSLLGSQFTFQRAEVRFLDRPTPDPELDLLAQATTSSLTANVAVTGRASAPKLALTSEPSLPQDEILSRVLFNRSTNQLSGFEAAQLAASASQLLGLGGNAGILDQVRRTLGVDRLRLTGAGRDGTGGGIEAGRYLHRGVYLGLEQGVGAAGGSAGSAGSRAKVEVDLLDHVQAEAGVGLGGGAQPSVGLKFEWDY